MVRNSFGGSGRLCDGIVGVAPLDGKGAETNLDGKPPGPIVPWARVVASVRSRLLGVKVFPASPVLLQCVNDSPR